MADILIVDDDLDVAWILQQALERDGHMTRTAHHGEQGLRLLAEHLPELVLLDVEMPVLDGQGMVYQMFVRNCGQENIPVILLSGTSDFLEVVKRIGTPYYLPKPFDLKDLQALIGRALNERALPRPSR